MPSATRSLAPWLAAAVVAWTASDLSAQEPLTIERAIQDALAHNASLRAVRAGVTEADARADEAGSGWLPRVSVTETWQRGNQPVYVFSSLLASRQFGAENFAIDALNHPDATGFFRNSIAVEQMVFDGGRQRSATESARSRREIAQLSSDEAAAALVVTTVQAFGRTLLAESGQRAAEAALEAAREDLGRAERRRDAGFATDADVLSLVAHVAELQQRAIEQLGEAAVSRAELNRLMGAPVEREYQLVQPPDTDTTALAATQADVLLAEADRSRPELRRTAAAERAATADRKAAGAALIPEVAAQAALDFSGLEFGSRTSSWLVGAEVRWNLSIGGAEAARRRAAAGAHARVTAEAEDARAAVQVEVVTALRRLQTAAARREAGRASVEQARESYRIIRDRFEAGFAGVTDVLRASSAVVEAERRRTAAAVDAIVSAATLRRALGRQP